jgi:hypothetical protein
LHDRLLDLAEDPGFTFALVLEFEGLLVLGPAKLQGEKRLMSLVGLFAKLSQNFQQAVKSIR